MGSGKMRSTRRLRNWMVEQVSSGKYPGLVWDDVAKTMFRIPWKHAGKQDFRSDEDGAIFKAWAEFKGKLTEEGRNDPASWKTRLRCALNKSPEFTEVVERSQLDISEPYKVYRLVPTNEQGVEVPEKKSKPVGRQKRMSSRSDSEDVVQVKQMKEEEIPSQLCVEEVLQANDVTLIHMEEFAPQSVTMQKEGLVDEIQLDVRIEAPGAQDSFHVAIRYLGEEVLKRDVLGSDIRITYLPSFSVPPTRASLVGGFPRIALPEPPSSLPCAELQALSTLLPYMEKGVALTSTHLGIYGTRFCQGRVFWRGPHTATPGPCRMERNTEPVMLFSKEVFKR
ncbi:interferon regulatory factor 9-like, partial [Diretmus argenteus]